MTAFTAEPNESPMKEDRTTTKDHKTNGSGSQDGDTQNNQGPFSWTTDTIVVNGTPCTIVFPEKK